MKKLEKKQMNAVKAGTDWLTTVSGILGVTIDHIPDVIKC